MLRSEQGPYAAAARQPLAPGAAPGPGLPWHPIAAAEGGAAAEVTAPGLCPAPRIQHRRHRVPLAVPFRLHSRTPIWDMPAARALGSIPAPALPPMVPPPAERLPPCHPAHAVGHVQPGAHPLLHAAVSGLHGVSPRQAAGSRALGTAAPSRPGPGGSSIHPPWGGGLDTAVCCPVVRAASPQPCHQHLQPGDGTWGRGCGKDGAALRRAGAGCAPRPV